MIDRAQSGGLTILRVASSLYPEKMGGVGLHTHTMSKMQAEMGHDVTVLTSDNGDRSLTREERRDGYRLIRHREVARPIENTITPGLVPTLREEIPHCDVLHIHSHLYFSSSVAACFARAYGVPTVLTNHGLVSQTAPGWLQKSFNSTLGSFTFESAGRILCYTETDRRRLLQQGIETDISVISNGIDCSEFRPLELHSNRELLFVGRLAEGKGPQYLIDAFAGVSADYPALGLKLIGEGPMRGELERRIETLGLSDRVELIGEVANHELPSHYNESLAFVLPSLSEGMPRTLMEAMACGLPVVTSDLEQLRPVVDGLGYTAESGSSKELERAIRTLLETEDLAALGRRARKRAVEDFSWQETVERTVEEYYAVIDESSDADSRRATPIRTVTQAEERLS